MSRSRTLRALSVCGLAAVSLTSGLLLAPAASAADTTTATIHDVAGDATTGGLFPRNVATLDLLQIDITRDPTNLTAAIRLAAVDPGSISTYRADIGLAPDPGPNAPMPDLHVDITGTTAQLVVTSFQSEAGTSTTIPATPVYDTATGTVSISVSRAQIDPALLKIRSTPLSTTEPVAITASSNGRAPGLFGGTASDFAN